MRNNIKGLTSLIYSSLSVALVVLATMIIKIPAIKGYINFGDIFIFTIAILFGKKKGFIAGAMGSAIADILLGYMIFAPGTFIIKGTEGLICGVIAEKMESHEYKNVALVSAVALGAFIMILGYFFYEWVVFGLPVAAASVGENAIQGGVSAITAIPITVALRKTGINFRTEG